MNALSARAGGGIIAVAGGTFTLFHLSDAQVFSFDPVLLVLEALVPLCLSLATVVAGVSMARGHLVPDRFAGRALMWTGMGALALSGMVLWVFAYALIEGFPTPNFRTAILNAVTLGGLIGLLVGVYDARNRKQQADLDRLNRINGTLRIATEEMVEHAGRDALEQAVCDRLAASDSYEAVWIGRYDPDVAQIRPATWAGMPDEYFESIEVTVDDTPTGNGPGGRAIKEREIQSVPDVFADPSMEPWWDILGEQGVTSLAVVPVAHGETVYGFYSIYADRSEVFDDTEREVLAELGETLGHAIASLQAHERLARRELELSRQNERLEEFASVVSHDLRNPIEVAQGYLQLEREARGGVERGATDDWEPPGDGGESAADGSTERATGTEGESADRDGNLARVGRALTRMGDLVDDLLTLARQGRAVDDFAPASLRSVADDAWATVDADAATLRADGDLGRVSCDESRLRQLFENLFRNSVEHGSTSSRAKPDDSVEHGSTNTGSDAGRADVTITVGRTDDGFYVADDGPGVPDSERSTVFQTGYSSNPEGTGFGLNIVRSVAEAHGWDVTLAESEAGGARFEFTGVETPDAVPGSPDDYMN